MKSKKTFINVIFSSIYQIVAVICGLITPRLILVAFGSTYNGVISSVTQFLSVISFLSMGIPGAARVELYKYLSINDNDGISKVVKATQKYSQNVAWVLTVYAVALCIIYPYISNSDLLPFESAIIILIVAMGLFLEYFFGMAYYNVIDADQKIYIRYALRTVATILNTIMVVVLIKMNCRIFVIKFVSSLAFAITPFFVHQYVDRKYKIDKNVFADMSIIPGRKNVLIHAISSFVHENVDIFTLTIFLDIKMVSVYTLYHAVIYKLRTLLEIFTGDLESAFGKLWLENDNDRLKDVFNAYETFIFSFIIIVFSCAAILIMPFIKLYTIEVHDVNYYIVSFGILMVVTEGVYCIRDPYRILIQATGSYEQTKWIVIFEAIVNLLLSIVLTMKIGMNGVLIGTIVSTGLTAFFFSHFVYISLIKQNFYFFGKRTLWACMSMIFVIFICKFMKLNVANSWSRWGLNAMMVFIVSFVLTILMDLIFYKKDLIILENKFFVAIKGFNK